MAEVEDNPLDQPFVREFNPDDAMGVMVHQSGAVCVQVGLEIMPMHWSTAQTLGDLLFKAAQQARLMAVNQTEE